MEMKNLNWRLDDDGFLRVTANILKEGVFPYGKDEVPEELANTISSPSVMQLIPSEEFTEEALKTLEGKPLIVDSHEWQTPENAKDGGLIVGSVAGTPTVEGDYIKCEFIVTDQKTIDAIMAKELSEVSAGYRSNASPESGEYDGDKYDVVQRNLRFNHVLLVPQGMSGRCGHDVRIMNSNKNPEQGGKPMFTQTVGNAEFKFSTEEDLNAATAMAEAKVANAIEDMKKSEKAEDKEEEKESAAHEASETKDEEKAEHKDEEKTEEKSEEKAENHEPEAIEDEMGAIKKALADAMDLVKKYESEEYAYAAAEKIANEKKEAEEVMEAEEGDEEMKKNCSEAKTMNAVRKAIIAHHVKKNGIEATEAEHPTIWKLMVANAKKKTEMKAKNAVKTVENKENTLFPKREVPVPQKTENSVEKSHPVFARPN